jgi:hypothetical protein
MPNWCYTEYALVGSEENVKNAFESLEKLENTPRKSEKEYSFESHSDWLGYVVTDILGESWEDVACRGTFNELEYSHDINESGDYALTFNTETAWGPCEELMEKLAEKFNLSLNYRSEEFGMCFFEKRNPDNIFPTQFCYCDETNTECFDSLEDFIMTYGEHYDIPMGTPIEEVQAIIREKDEEANLYEFEEV